MFKKDKNNNNNKEELVKENPFVSNNNDKKQESEEMDDQERTKHPEEVVCYEDFCELKNKFEKLNEDKQVVDSHYIRLAADFDNYRKRQEQEREALLKYGAEDTVKKLLPVLDTFERAQTSLKEIDDPEKLKESFEAVKKQFLEALEKLGVEKIEAVGKEFDPNIHEAIMQTPTTEQPDNTVITELQSGYKLCDKILRPTLVNVAVNE